jgi:hypothetical protein
VAEFEVDLRGRVAEVKRLCYLPLLLSLTACDASPESSFQTCTDPATPQALTACKVDLLHRRLNWWKSTLAADQVRDNKGIEDAERELRAFGVGP